MRHPISLNPNAKIISSESYFQPIFDDIEGKLNKLIDEVKEKYNLKANLIIFCHSIIINYVVGI